MTDQPDPAVDAALAKTTELIGRARTERAAMVEIIEAVDAARAEAGWVPPWLQRWGSDCADCGNATHASMRCDNCGGTDTTFALYYSPAAIPDVEH